MKNFSYNFNIKSIFFYYTLKKQRRKQMKKIAILALGTLSIFTSLALADDIKSSIKMGFFESEKKAIKEVKISMIKAIKVAKSVVDGKVIKAELEKEDGYLVYEIKILTPKDDEEKVYIDPVTAKVLKKED